MLSVAGGDAHPSALGYVLFLGERSTLFFGCVASPPSAMLTYGFLMKRGGALPGLFFGNEARVYPRPSTRFSASIKKESHVMSYLILHGGA